MMYYQRIIRHIRERIDNILGGYLSKTSILDLWRQSMS